PRSAKPSDDSSPPGRDAKPSLHLRPCHVDDVDGEARCGSLAVFENRALGAGRRISLKVVVLPARVARARQPDPIFLLTGGPGLGVATMAWTADLLGRARDERDVVLVDQRGT